MQTLDEMDLPQDTVPVMEDSTTAIAAFTSDKRTRAARHYDVKLFMGKDYIDRQIFVMLYIRTGMQLADQGTKALAAVQFDALDDALMGRGYAKLQALVDLTKATAAKSDALTASKGT